MSSLKQTDVRQISHTLKEAVSSAILHETFDRLRGAGEFGRVVLREKPSKRFHTQNLLPRRKPDPAARTYLEKDDVTSPSHIGTIGMSFQIADGVPGSIEIAAKGAIYMRVLPTAEDLIANPIVFRLSRQARSAILRHRRDVLRELFDANKDRLGAEGRGNPLWKQLQADAMPTARQRALDELGVSVQTVPLMGARDALAPTIAEADEAPDADDPSVQVGLEQDSSDGSDETSGSDGSAGDAADGADGFTVFEFVVAPDSSNPPPDVLVQREQIPHKWVRIPVDLGTLTLNLSADERAKQTEIDNFNSAMVAAIRAAVDSWLRDNEASTGGALWAFPAGSGTRSVTVSAIEVANWANTLNQLRSSGPRARPTITLALEVEDLADPIRQDERTVRVILANESDLLDPRQAAARETDHSIFQVELAVKFPKGIHRPVRLERIAPSYRYNDYLSHAALGINCGVRLRGLTDPSVLETTVLPSYFQPITQAYQTNPPPRFDALGAEDGGIAILQKILSDYDQWLRDVETAAPYSRGLEHEHFASDLAREKRQFEEVDFPGWKAERDALARGIRVIERAVEARNEGAKDTDPAVLPLTAWRFMNQAFALHWKAKNVSEWRLFQISFILTQLPSIVSRLEVWRSDPEIYRGSEETEASLLYFGTGGGKSESFFGLLVFALAFDRLRGKERGVTALIRYPLRLLTSQQTQRLAQILAAAQKVRWAWEDNGLSIPGKAFEIGFWVGGGNTPNYPGARGVSAIPVLSSNWNEATERQGDYALYRKRWLRLPNCPFCSGSLSMSNGEPQSTVGLRRMREGEDTRLAHVCFNKQCEWNTWSGKETVAKPRPLPIHIMDSDIYAHAPSVLVGTVDKLALIGQSARTIPKILGMFGFAAWKHCETGRLITPTTREQFRKGPGSFSCEPLWPFYSDGLKEFFDPYPLLEIQDEAHLLDESLGTFSGLFETTFHHALRELSPLLAGNVVLNGAQPHNTRIVAASATVMEPERQIDQIYQRRVVIFPRAGADLYQSFYARLMSGVSGDTARNASSNPEHFAPTRRRYVSFLTNGLTHTAATVAVLSAFHLTISTLLGGIIDGDNDDRRRIRAWMADRLPEDAFRVGHAAALTNASITDDDVASAIDLNRIALLYVTNKKGGDNVKAALQDIVRRDHRLAGLSEITGVRTALITGAIDAGRIGGIVEEASTRPAVGATLSSDVLERGLRSVIATSAISHGVDVDEFNVMYFAGQPADIAEYIQASSRVGRTHVGVSVLIPTPQQRRDRYIVETHDVFHRFLERMIHAASVERWAEQAIVRTMSSFFQLKVCGVDFIRSMSRATTPDEKARCAEPDNLGEIGERSRTRHIEYVDDLHNFIINGIGLYHATSPRNKEFYTRRVRDLLDRATTAMERSNWRTEPLANFFAQPNPPLAKPMTSLRDVDEAGYIEGGYGIGSDRIRKADIGKVMTALMRGSNSWSDGENGE